MGDKAVEMHIPSHLRYQDSKQLITYTEVYTRVLGVEWDATTDAFRPLVPINYTYEPGKLTKRRLLSEVAKLFDVLGWCSPCSDHHTQNADTAPLGRTFTLGRPSFPHHRRGLGKMDCQDYGTSSMIHKKEVFPSGRQRHRSSTTWLL